MGPLSLGNLESGEFRFLTDREANALRELVDQRMASVERGEEPTPGPKRPIRERVGPSPREIKSFREESEGGMKVRTHRCGELTHESRSDRPSC